MNRYNPDIHHRRSVRLKGFDYSKAGAYFVTICTRDRACSLGQVENGVVRLSEAGFIVEEIWSSLPSRFRDVLVDAFVVMPNHVHGIVLIEAQFIAPGVVRGLDALNPDATPQDAMNRAPTPGERAQGGMNRAPTSDEPAQGGVTRAPTLGECVRTFKAASTRLIRVGGNEEFVWQRNYYEHVIRDDDELGRVKEYIRANPENWDSDEHNVRTS
jgi:REP element-mobilizing transposase RayT